MTEDITGREILVGDTILCSLVRDRTARMKIGIVANLPGNNRVTVHGYERDLRTGEWGGAWRSNEPTKGTISYASVKALIITNAGVIPCEVMGRLDILRHEIMK